MYGATPEEAASWVNNFGTRLEATIAQIESRFPGGCEIFMANIFDPTDGFGDAERVGWLPPWKDATKILDAYKCGVILQCETRAIRTSMWWTSTTPFSVTASTVRSFGVPL